MKTRSPMKRNKTERIEIKLMKKHVQSQSRLHIMQVEKRRAEWAENLTVGSLTSRT